MTTFTSRFDGWAHEKEGKLSEDIQKLADSIAALKGEIAKIFTAMATIGAISGVALPAVAVGAVVVGPLVAPFVIGVGLILAVGTVASIATLGFMSAGASSSPFIPLITSLC